RSALAVPALLFCLASARGIGFGRPDLSLLRQAIRFGLRAWSGGLAHFLNARVDQIIMGLIASEAALGIYAVAVNGSEGLFYVPSGVAGALLPAAPGGGAGALGGGPCNLCRGRQGLGGALLRPVRRGGGALASRRTRRSGAASRTHAPRVP